MQSIIVSSIEDVKIRSDLLVAEQPALFSDKHKIGPMPQFGGKSVSQKHAYHPDEYKVAEYIYPHHTYSLSNYGRFICDGGNDECPYYRLTDDIINIVRCLAYSDALTVIKGYHAAIHKLFETDTNLYLQARIKYHLSVIENQHKKAQELKSILAMDPDDLPPLVPVTPNDIAGLNYEEPDLSLKDMTTGLEYKRVRDFNTPCDVTDKLAKLQKELREAAIEIDSLKKDRDALETKLEIANNNVSMLDDSQHELSKSNVVWKKACEDKHAKLAIAETEIQNLTLLLSKMIDARDLYQDACNNREDELQDAHARLTSVTSDRDELRLSYASKKEKIKVLRDQNTALTADIANLKLEKYDLVNLISTIKGEYAEMKTLVGTLKSKLSAAERANSDANDKIEELTSSLKNSQRDLFSKIDDLNTLNNQINKFINAIRH